MLALVLTVFLTIVQAPPPVPREAAHDESRAGSNVNDDSNRHKNPSVPSPVENPISTQANQQSGEKPSPTDTSEAISVCKCTPVPKSGKDWWDKTYIIFTGMLVAIGAVGVCAAIKTLKILRRQTAVAIKAARAARDNAIAAKLAAQAAINAERARIDGEIIKAKYNSDTSSEEMEDAIFGKAPQQRDLTIQVFNRGRSPARLSSLKYAFHIEGEPPQWETKPLHALLPALTDRPEMLETVDLVSLISPQEWKDIWNGKAIGILRVSIEYFDLISGRTETRETGFLYRIAGSTLERDAENNRYT
jgi:hypothetical protein